MTTQFLKWLIPLCISFVPLQAFAEIKCDDAAVVDAFQLHVACPSNGICDSLGVKTYREYQNLTDQQIANATNELLKPLWQITPQNEARTAFNNDFTGHALKLAFLRRNIFKEIKTSPTDYNEAIQRYSCRAEYTYNEDYYRADVLFGFVKRQMDGQMNLLLQTEIGNNDPKAWSDILGVAQIQANSIGLRCLKAHRDFTVQPSGHGGWFHHDFIINFPWTAGSDNCEN
jgi:hypothetical protein